MTKLTLGTFFVPDEAHWSRVRHLKTDVGTGLNKALEAVEDANVDSLQDVLKHRLILPNCTDFRSPLPPIEEQCEIEARVGAMNKEIETLSASEGKLKSVRHGLMADLLNGRVRVPLPEPAHEAA
jgi:hypothetical protein